MALWLLQNPSARPDQLVTAMQEATEQVKPCEECGLFTVGETCSSCTDSNRDRRVICVVEQAPDAMKIDRSGAFTGLYHCLGGKLSPLDNVGPDDLRIAALIERVRRLGVEEVILAVGSDVEGEATANYLMEELASEACAVSRIAQGMPAGGGFDHADELTLLRAMTGRKRL